MVRVKDDTNTWLNLDAEKPAPFSLLDFLLDDDLRIRGWWTGSDWYSRKLGSRQIVKWRKRQGQY